MTTTLKIWFDKEGDFLEVLFSDQPSYMEETDNSVRYTALTTRFLSSKYL